MKASPFDPGYHGDWRGGVLSNQPQPFHARMPVLADDDVIVHGDAERTGDVDDRLGHLDIRLRSHAGGLELACALHLGVGLMIARAL